MALEQGKPTINSYDITQTQNWEHDRDIREIEGTWRLEDEFAIPTVDQLLSEQIELAIASGKSEVAVLDIGSGDGGLLYDVVNHPKKLAKTWQLLQTHPELKIKLIGLTDAKKPEDFLAKIAIPTSTENPQLTADNYFYTVTATQTIEQFLEAAQQPEVQLILATVSLAYMGANTFSKTMDDSFAALGPSGKMLVSNYGTKHPGFHVSSIVKTLNASGLQNSEQEWQQDLHALFTGDASADDVDLNTFLGMANDIMKRFQRIPEMAQAFEIAKKKMELRMQTLPKLLRNIFVGRKKKEHELYGYKNVFVVALITAIQELGERKVRELWHEKINILDRFVEQYQDQLAKIERTDTTIYLQKNAAVQPV